MPRRALQNQIRSWATHHRANGSIWPRKRYAAHWLYRREWHFWYYSPSLNDSIVINLTKYHLVANGTRMRLQKILVQGLILFHRCSSVLLDVWIARKSQDSSVGSLAYRLIYCSLAQNTILMLLFLLKGGPGCSSELALFSENGPYSFTIKMWWDSRSHISGPYKVNKNMSLSLNPYSWNSFANLLYVDQVYFHNISKVWLTFC